MPFVRITTNIRRDELPHNFSTGFAKIFGKVTSGPKRCIIHVECDQDISFAGSKDPCIMVSVASVSIIDKEKNKETSKHITDFIKGHLGVNEDHIYLHFIPIEKQNLGFRGTTFADLEQETPPKLRLDNPDEEPEEEYIVSTKTIERTVEFGSHDHQHHQKKAWHPSD